jgi:hypothetical protein
MSIKKAFLPLVEFLTTNKDKRVKEILEQIQEMCSAKGAGGTASTFHRDENGAVTHIQDYYFKKFFPLSHVDFGPKAGSPSGYNSMCKEGVSNWTRQQREFKAAKEALLNAVAAGEVKPDQIAAKLEELEVARTKIVPYSVEGMGWDTLEEALAVPKEQLDRIVAKHNEKLAKAAQAAADEAAKNKPAAA